jgi:CheY-like chemotaxis protein
MTDRLATQKQEREQAQRKHVLVVNGHPPFLELLRVVLQDAQFNVTTTNYVPHTFDLITALAPSLIIVDLIHGQQAGWELLERVHADPVTSEIPLLLISAYPGMLRHAKQKVPRYGSHPTLHSPFHVAELLEAVQGLIGHA